MSCVSLKHFSIRFTIPCMQLFHCEKLLLVYNNRAGNKLREMACLPHCSSCIDHAAASAARKVFGDDCHLLLCQWHVMR